MIDSETILISLIVLSIIVFVATTYLLSVGPNHKWYNRKMAVAIGLLGGSIAISLVTIPLALPKKIVLPYELWYSSQPESFAPGVNITFVAKVPSYVVLVDQQVSISVIMQNDNILDSETSPPIQVGLETFTIKLNNYEANKKFLKVFNIDIKYDKISNTFGVKLTTTENVILVLEFICRLSSPPLFVFTPRKDDFNI